MPTIETEKAYKWGGVQALLCGMSEVSVLLQLPPEWGNRSRLRADANGFSLFVQLIYRGQEVCTLSVLHGPSLEDVARKAQRRANAFIREWVQRRPPSSP